VDVKNKSSNFVGIWYYCSVIWSECIGKKERSTLWNWLRDISGDGKAKELSKEEESSVGSLMGKLGLDDGSSFVSEKDSKDEIQDTGMQRNSKTN
jgi:hypothetical protein